MVDIVITILSIAIVICCVIFINKGSTIWSIAGTDKTSSIYKRMLYVGIFSGAISAGILVYGTITRNLIPPISYILLALSTIGLLCVHKYRSIK